MNSEDKCLGAAATVGGVAGLCLGVWWSVSILISNWEQYSEGTAGKLVMGFLFGLLFGAFGAMGGVLAGLFVLGPVFALIAWLARAGSRPR
jgi:hypothetical protein